MPSSARSSVEPGFASQPVTVTPRRARSSASARIPAPAMPTKWTGRESQLSSGFILPSLCARELARLSSGRLRGAYECQDVARDIGRRRWGGTFQRRRRHDSELARVRKERLHGASERVGIEVALADHLRRTGRGKRLRVRCLMVCCRGGEWHYYRRYSPRT